MFWSQLVKKWWDITTKNEEFLVEEEHFGNRLYLTLEFVEVRAYFSE